MMESITVAAPKREGAGETVAAPRHDRASVVLAFAFAAGVLLAAAVYQPWVGTPFDMLDFSEFLPFLVRHDAFTQRFAEFATYYATQGRLNLLSYAFLIWKWSLFGWNEAAWQIARFVQMQCIVVGVYLLLRRLGASRTGSAVGAALFIVAGTTSPAWIRLTMGEPLGLVAILGASLLATWYQATARWRIAGAAIAILLMASLMAKEMLVPFVPFVVLLACALNPQGHFERVHQTQRNVWLASFAVLGVLVVLIPVAIVGIRAGPGAYAADYAVGSISLGRLIHPLVVVLLPVLPAQAPDNSLAHVLAGVTLFAIIAVGLALAQTNPDFRRHCQYLATAAMSLAVAGALVYLPWPHFQNFYGLPYLLCPAILVAVSITSIETNRPSWRWVSHLGCVLMLVQGALYAAHDARRATAVRVVNGTLVGDFAAHESADSIVVLMRHRWPETQAWQSRGATLERYAKAVLPGRHVPAIGEALCSAAQPMMDHGIGGAILVSYSISCGTLPNASRVARYDYTYLEWPSLAARRDSLVVSILGPEQRQ